MAKEKDNERFFSRKTKKEWKDWGEKFGERIKDRTDDFAEEVSDLGERVSSRFEEKKEQRRPRLRWIFWPLGLVWPIVSSVFGLIFLLIGIAIMNFLNLGLGSSFISALSVFLLSNLHWLFAAGLFFGYAKFFLKMIPSFRWIFSPIVGSIGITFVAWLLVGVFSAINVSAKSGFIAKLTGFVSSNLLEIFVFFLVLGYALMFLGKIFRSLFIMEE